MRTGVISAPPPMPVNPTTTPTNRPAPATAGSQQSTGPPGRLAGSAPPPAGVLLEDRPERRADADLRPCRAGRASSHAPRARHRSGGGPSGCFSCGAVSLLAGVDRVVGAGQGATGVTVTGADDGPAPELFTARTRTVYRSPLSRSVTTACTASGVAVARKTVPAGLVAVTR